MDETEKQGAIVRGAGSCVLVTDLEAHRTDWRRAVRIILNVMVPGCVRYTVFGDDAMKLQLSHQKAKRRLF